MQVKELESKLKEREQQLEAILLHSADKLRATPNDRKSFFDECMSESDAPILRSSNSNNRPMSHGSVLLRGPDSLHEIRRKREKRSASFGESENSIVVLPVSLLEKKSLPTELTRPRQLDPSRELGRHTRTSKAVTATQRNFTHSRINREQLGGKERDKTRATWNR